MIFMGLGKFLRQGECYHPTQHEDGTSSRLLCVVMVLLLYQRVSVL